MFMGNQECSERLFANKAIKECSFQDAVWTPGKFYDFVLWVQPGV